MSGAGIVHDALERQGWDVEIADARKVKVLASWPARPTRLGVSARALGLERLAQLDRPRRLSAAGRLEIALLRPRPPAAGLGTPTIPECFSTRVGCKTPSALSFGVDLGSLCLGRG
jgi:hypothetical protein